MIRGRNPIRDRPCQKETEALGASRPGSPQLPLTLSAARPRSGLLQRLSPRPSAPDGDDQGAARGPESPGPSSGPSPPLLRDGWVRAPGRLAGLGSPSSEIRIWRWEGAADGPYKVTALARRLWESCVCRGVSSGCEARGRGRGVGAPSGEARGVFVDKAAPFSAAGPVPCVSSPPPSRGPRGTPGGEARGVSVD